MGFRRFSGEMPRMPVALHKTNKRRDRWTFTRKGHWVHAQRAAAITALSRCAVMTALATFATGQAAHASPLPDPQRIITYAVVDQNLRDVLTGIAAQLGLRTEISAHVQGQVHGRLPPAGARLMLDRLAALYGFDWYCDGRTLFITSYDEAVSKILPLGEVSPTEFVQTLRQLDVSDSRWPLRVARASDVAEVSGPPHYAALVDQTLAALAQSAKAGVAEVRVFRGTAASP
jgi:type II secretory pathway component GspD/PulD (secretin)